MGNDCLYGKADAKGLQRPDPARQANLWQSLEMTVKTGQFFTGAEKSLNSSLLNSRLRGRKFMIGLINLLSE